MFSLWILVIAIGLVSILGVFEHLKHQKNLNRIPIRIHVNGTRGKSSVTRLITAGLREGGITTCAKITGTLARMILPDGSEYPIYRPSGGNVIEQKRIVRTAVAYNAQAFVVECMALQPILQWICESKFINATHGVITNARDDHIDIMGPTAKDVALALLGMVPFKGKLFTTETKFIDIFKVVSKDRSTELIPTTQTDIDAVSDEDIGGFSYVEHKENVALALSVCQSVGVDKETAIRGMWKVKPDAGALSCYKLVFFGRTIFFANGFAANDPESTEMIWNLMLNRYQHANKRIAVFNCREDRPDRSWQLGAACVKWHPADHYVLMGTGTFIIVRAMRKHGMDMSKVYLAENRDVANLFEIIVNLAGDSGFVMGMGNIGGEGLALVQYFQNRSVLEKYKND